MNTMNLLTGFPSWMSMPSLLLPASQALEALRALDRELRRSRVLHRINNEDGDEILHREGSGGSAESGRFNGRVRVYLCRCIFSLCYEIFDLHR